ncbi:damage-inducible protein DinB [Paenibacillus sp. 79R4]|uniref:DinB family protein n=1 Tax=Paenibacillus sp. 79R4 TaxID=2212847 RepID=UPI0015C0D2B9|nr:DinB family protein [Paenibacillus sp. 79R4]NWL88431.1 damage-inducible protein DinB [Paenibacillus sp. 79R4]
MKALFQYNWQVRDEWFDVLESIPPLELIKERGTGVGSYLKTLFHILDVEYSWIRAMQNEPDIVFPFEEYQDVQALRNLSNELRVEIREFIDQWTHEMEYEMVHPSWQDKPFCKGEILRHILVHEIHHIGQFSIWSKEIGIQVVSSNFIGRELM